MHKRIVFTGIVVAVFALFFILHSGSGENMPIPTVVFTQLPASSDEIPLGTENLPPDYKNAQIVSLNYENLENGIENLTAGFYSSVSPSLSFDNQKIVFSAKEKETDFWQIWTMNLDGSNAKKVFEGTTNCYTPSFLPTGDVVFSCEVDDPQAGKLFPLFKIQAGGSGFEQITFHPHRDLYSSMLHDGRIAMVSQQVYPEKDTPVFMVLRPDGTKAQAFYHSNSDHQIKSAVREIRNEKLLFVQTNGYTDELVTLSYANPLLPTETIFSLDAGGIHSADILDSTRVVISARSAQNEVFGLLGVGFDGSKTLIYDDEEYHSIQPVALRQRRIPKKLPTSVSSEEGSGILISQNVNQSQIGMDEDPDTKYVRIEGIGSTLEEIEVAEDGSFYLRVQSDMPVRFVSLDANKEVLRGPSAWVWMRTNERRACVGCHAQKEMAPRNIVPMAINEEPVMITDSSKAVSVAVVEALREMMNQQ